MEQVYSRTHEWAKRETDGVIIGISNHAAEEIGEVANIGLPQPGDNMQAGDVLVEIESVKSINEICTPVAGRVLRVNTALYDDPTALNRDPEGAAWLVVLESDANLSDLLSREDYLSLVQPEAG